MRTILVYTVPAWGHVNAMLAVLEALKGRGYRVLAYSTRQFAPELIKAGAEFRPYSFDDREIDLRDGSRLLKFYCLILRFTQRLLPELLGEAAEAAPFLILHDSAAHWGKRVGEHLGVPGVSFCSFVAVRGGMGPDSLLYALHFLGSTLRDLSWWAAAGGARRALKNQGYRKFGLKDVLLNHQKLHVISYSKLLQPGRQGFGAAYFFLGPAATLRHGTGAPPPPNPGDRPAAYLSFGTIQNKEKALLTNLLGLLRQGGYRVYLSDGGNLFAGMGDDTLHISRYFDQMQVLRQVDVFLTAGGVNSVCESIAAGVPCLLFPRQGEQRICGKQAEKLGFGLVARMRRPLLPQIARAKDLKITWKKDLAAQASKVELEALLARLALYGEGKA